MPWDVGKVKGGFKVKRKTDDKTYSKAPQTHSMAMAQLKAMYANMKGKK